MEGTVIRPVTAVDGPKDGWHGDLATPIRVYAGDHLDVMIHGHPYRLAWEGDEVRFLNGDACLVYDQRPVSAREPSFQSVEAW